MKLFGKIDKSLLISFLSKNVYKRCGYPIKFRNSYNLDNGLLRFIPITVDVENWEIKSIQAYFDANLQSNDFFADFNENKVAEFHKKIGEVTVGINTISLAGKERVFLKKGCKNIFFFFFFL